MARRGTKTSKPKSLAKIISGRISQKKGKTNEERSVLYILENKKKYGVDRDRIDQPTKGLKYTRDFFGHWDIMTCPTDEPNPFTPSGERPTFYFYFIQVKSYMPSKLEILRLGSFRTPFFIKKELHIWYADGRFELIEFP